MMHYAWDFRQSETERNFEWIISHFIERFHSRGLHLCEFFGTKERVCIRKEFNSQRIGLGHQHGRRFIVVGHQHGRRFTVVGHQYGRRDVMWKHSISWKLFLVSFSVLWKPPFLHLTMATEFLILLRGYSQMRVLRGTHLKLGCSVVSYLQLVRWHNIA